MATFKEIQKANESISCTNIKGKEYAEVNQRVKAYRMVYPTGRIVTTLVSVEDGICIFRAEVFDGDGNILGTGTAYEKESSSFINKTSYIENCETSAVGRALGFCGFGIDTSICSADELTNAINNQGTKEKAPSRKVEHADKAMEDAKRRAYLIKLINDNKINQKALWQMWNIHTEINDMSDTDVRMVTAKIEEILEKRGVKR